MDGSWLRYGFYGALIGFVVGFLAGFTRARRGSATRARRSDKLIDSLYALLQKHIGGDTDDETTP